MASKNDVTGDKIISKGLSEEGKKNFELVFPPKKKERWIPPPIEMKCPNSSASCFCDGRCRNLAPCPASYTKNK